MVFLPNMKIKNIFGVLASFALIIVFEISFERLHPLSIDDLSHLSATEKFALKNIADEGVIIMGEHLWDIRHEKNQQDYRAERNLELTAQAKALH